LEALVDGKPSARLGNFIALCSLSASTFVPQNRLEPVLYKNEATGIYPTKSNHFPLKTPKNIPSV